MKNLYIATIVVVGLIAVLFGSEIKIIYATQTTGDPYGIGNVTNGTYNETAALQRITQLMNMHDTLLQEKQRLESQLVNATNATDTKTINMKIENVTGQIDQIMQEFNGIQAENLKLYYIDPTLLQKYQAASDNFASKIQAQYWNGKATFDDKKNAFPLVQTGVDGKKKAVEITLWKGIENSTKADQYVAIVKELIPTDVPWFVDYGEYPTSYISVQKQNPVNITSQILSPHQQFKSGIAANNVKCENNLQLVIKAEDGHPACVSYNTSKMLVERGWAKPI